ncbi:MAG: 5,10-methylenetetrahydromethanopterin reductase [Actinomycetia bacterium]|nr:5,10-methylenetetrahydromethanopterin reductase [Actinomycetes bacterium]
MSARELGLGLQSNKRPGDYAVLAAIAEDAGFDVITVFNDLFFQPALPALLEIARATERARVGPSCLNPFTVHPVEIAGQTAALDLASNGRAFLGLAAGAWLDRVGVDASRPLTAIREAWEVVRRLLAGDDSGFEGERFSLQPGNTLAYEPLRREVPLLVGTWSPRLTAFAGEHAAELKLGGCANPAMVRLARERLGSSETRIVVGAVTVVDEDDAAARALARDEVALYLPVVAGHDPTVDVDVNAPEISDQVLDLFAFAGSPERIAEHAEALFAAGADRVEFGTPHGIDERRGVDLLGTRVLPRLRL